MRRVLVALALVGFLVAGATTVAAQDADNDTEMDEPDDLNETEDDEEMEENETEDEEMEEAENETEEEQERERGESAQFDARLQTAIETVEVLVDIAPNDEAEQGLQDALDSLEEVQENTDTASLGPEEEPGEAPEEGEQEEESDQGSEEAGDEEADGRPDDRGPSENENRPGFVNRMLSGIFG